MKFVPGYPLIFCTFMQAFLFSIASAQTDHQKKQIPSQNKQVLGDSIHLVSYDVYHLVGTSILPGTRNSGSMQKYGLNLTGIRKTNCKGSVAPGHWLPDQVLSMHDTLDQLTVDISITDNCCYEFLCDAYVDSNAVLHILYTGYGEYCFCDCCFGLTYAFSKYAFTGYPDISGIMILNDPKTFRKIP